MARATPPELSKRVLFEVLTWACAVVSALFVGARAPERLSAFAYGFAAMVALAISRTGVAVFWNVRHQRTGRATAELSRPGMVRVLREALIGGLVVALAHQLGSDSPDAMRWLVYGMQALIGLAIATIGLWVWWGLRQRHRDTQ